MLEFWVWILIRAKLKAGEGELEPFNPNIGCVTQRKKMEDEDFGIEDEKAFLNDFYHMENSVENLFPESQGILEKEGMKKVKA